MDLLLEKLKAEEYFSNIEVAEADATMQIKQMAKNLFILFEMF